MPTKNNMEQITEQQMLDRKVALRNELDVLYANIEQAKAEEQRLQELVAELPALKDTHTQVSADLMQAKDDLAKTRAAVVATTKEHETAKADMNTRIVESKTVLDNISSVKDSLDREVKSLSNSIVKLEESRAALLLEMEYKDKKCDMLRDDIASKEAFLPVLEQKVKDHEDKCRALEAGMLSTGMKRADAEVATLAEKKKLEDLKEETAKLLKDMDKLRAEIADERVVWEGVRKVEQDELTAAWEENDKRESDIQLREKWIDKKIDKVQKAKTALEQFYGKRLEIEI